MDWAIAFPMQVNQATVHQHIRLEEMGMALGQTPLESHQAMTLEAYENFQVQSTTETHTPVILVKIGGQEQTGHVFLEGYQW